MPANRRSSIRSPGPAVAARQSPSLPFLCSMRAWPRHFSFFVVVPELTEFMAGCYARVDSLSFGLALPHEEEPLPSGSLVPAVRTAAPIVTSRVRRRWRAHVPDIAAVLPDRAIRREATHASGVENRHACPVVRTAVRLGDFALTVDLW